MCERESGEESESDCVGVSVRESASVRESECLRE